MLANLGKVLLRQEKVDEAIKVLRDAIRLAPKHDNAHNNLGNALASRGMLDEAIAEYRESIRLRPDIAGVHANLGDLLAKRGSMGEAIAELRTAVRLEPDNLGAHYYLAGISRDHGDLAGSAAEYRIVIRLQPNEPGFHYELAVVLNNLRLRDEAIAEYRAAIRLRPDFAEAHCNLGGVLQRKGAYAEALEMYKKGHALGSRRPNWGYPSAQWVADAEHKLTLANRLPAVLQGRDEPMDNAERQTFAELACWSKMYAGSTRLWAALLENDPKLGDDRQAARRINAACAAAMAATGKGGNEPPPDELAKAKFRRQALDWLRADLAAWGQFLKAGEREAPSAVFRNVGAWKQYYELAAVRDVDNLSKLTATERAEWQSLWADVDSLLKLASPSGATPSNSDQKDQAPPVETHTEPKPAASRPEAAPAEMPKTAHEPAAPVTLSDLHRRAHELERENPREAEVLLRKALKGYREAQGPDGPLTLELTKDVAVLLHRTKRPADAEPLFRDALERIRKQFGPDDDRAILIAASLGESLVDQAKWAAAEDVLREALERSRKQFGRDDPRASRPLAPLSLSLIRQRKWSAAEDVLRDALEQTRAQFGPDDPRAAGPLGSLGAVLVQQGKWSAAEPLVREALAIREKTQPDDWLTFNARSVLGGCLLGQEKCAEAEPLILAGYEGMKAREAKIPPPGKPNLSDAADRVVKLYEAWGKPEKAAEWRAKLEKPADEPKDRP
jgi:tetratricopeptide (TPR) repeat protein